MTARSTLRGVLWVETGAPTSHATELTGAARRQAEAAIAELNKLGVTVDLDRAGRARFHCSRKKTPPAARFIVERQADLIEAVLRERAPAKVAAFSPSTPSLGGKPMPSSADPPMTSRERGGE